MTVEGLIDYLQQFDGDVLVFLTEDQAADALSGHEAEEHPDYIALGNIDYYEETTP